MASNNDLDDFFKKKDRKTNKHKKTAGVLTNNQELLKQLVIVTEATTLFKETIDLDDETLDQQVLNDDVTVGTGFAEEAPKHHKTKLPDTNKHSYEQKSATVSKATDGQQQQQQQDEWEEFEAPRSKIEELRLKINGGRDADESDKDSDDYGEDNPNNNDNDVAAGREQQKDRPVWRINNIKEEEQQQQQQQQESEPVVEQKIEKPQPAQPSPSAYRPPHLRSSGSSVTAVGAGGVGGGSGVNSRVTKKKEPNLASTDEFPTLKSTANKK